MTTVYLSYRREDTAAEAGRLFYDMASHLGEGNLLMDVAGLEPGPSAARVLLDSVAYADHLLVMIGERWLRVRDEQGERRIDNPDDFVRQEVGAALALGKAVVPVLVQGARMPCAAELPQALRLLAERRPHLLTEATWQADVERLAQALAALPVRAAPHPGEIRLQLFPHEIFVSYAFRDHELAYRLVGALEAAGHRCWIAPRDIPPGTDSYAREIARAIKASRLVLVLVSKSSSESEDVLNEVTLAKNNRIPRLPLRIDQGPLGEAFEYFFSQSQWLVLPPGEADPAELVPAISGRL